MKLHCFILGFTACESHVAAAAAAATRSKFPFFQDLNSVTCMIMGKKQRTVCHLLH